MASQTNQIWGFAILSLVCLQLPIYEGVSNLTVSVDGVDVTNTLWANSTATHTVPRTNTTNHRHPRFTASNKEFRQGLNFHHTNDRKECLMDWAQIQNQRRFFVTSNKDEPMELTCHYCSDKESQKLLPMMWYKIMLGTLETTYKHYKVVEVELDMHDDESMNRVTVSADHTLKFKKTTLDDSAAYFCKNTDDTDIEQIKAGTIDNLMSDSTSFKVLYHINVIYYEFRHYTTVMRDMKGVTRWGGVMVYPAPPVYNYDENLMVKTVWDPWGPCDMCDVYAVKARKGYCYIQKIDPEKPVTSWHLDELLNFYPHGVTCKSNTVKHSGIFWNIVNSRRDEYERRSCYRSCVELVEDEEADEVDGLAMNINTKVSSDKTSTDVVKRTITRDSGQNLRIICPNTAFQMPVSWALDGQNVRGHPVDQLMIDAERKSYDPGRVFVDTLYSLRLKPIKKKDEGVITCWSNGMKKAVITLHVVGESDKDDIWTYLVYLLASFVVDFIIFLTILCFKHKKRPIQKNARLMSKRTPSEPSDSEVSADDVSDAESEVELITIGKDGNVMSSSSSSDEEKPPKKVEKRKSVSSQNFNRRKDVVLESSESLLSLGDNEEILISSDNSDKSSLTRPSLSTTFGIDNKINSPLNVSEKGSKASFHLSSLSSTPVPSSSSTTEVQTPMRSTSFVKEIDEPGSDSESSDSSSSTTSPRKPLLVSNHSSLSRRVFPSSSEKSGSQHKQTVQQWLSSTNSSMSIPIPRGKSSSILNSSNTSVRMTSSSSSSFEPTSRLLLTRGSSGDTRDQKLSRLSDALNSSETSSSSETLAKIPGWDTLANVAKSLALAPRKMTEIAKESQKLSDEDKTSVKTSATTQSGFSSSTSSIEMSSLSAMQPTSRSTVLSQLPKKIETSTSEPPKTPHPTQSKMSSDSAMEIPKPPIYKQRSSSEPRELDERDTKPQTTETEESEAKQQEHLKKSSIPNPIQLIKGETETSKTTQPPESRGNAFSGLSEAIKTFKDKHLPTSPQPPVKETDQEENESPQPRSNTLSMVSDVVKTFKDKPLKPVSPQPSVETFKQTDEMSETTQHPAPKGYTFSELSEAFKAFKDKHLPVSPQPPVKETDQEESPQPRSNTLSMVSDVVKTFKDKPLKPVSPQSSVETFMQTDEMSETTQHPAPKGYTFSELSETFKAFKDKHLPVSPQPPVKETDQEESPQPRSNTLSMVSDVVKTFKDKPLKPVPPQPSVPMQESDQIEKKAQQEISLPAQPPLPIASATSVPTKEDIDHSVSSPEEQKTSQTVLPPPPPPKQKGILKATELTQKTKQSSKDKEPLKQEMTSTSPTKEIKQKTKDVPKSVPSEYRPPDAGGTFDGTPYNSASSLPFPDSQQTSQGTPYHSASSLPFQGRPTRAIEDPWYIITPQTQTEIQASPEETLPTESENFEVSVRRSELPRRQDNLFHSTSSLPFNARK